MEGGKRKGGGTEVAEGIKERIQEDDEGDGGEVSKICLKFRMENVITALQIKSLLIRISYLKTFWNECFHGQLN